MRQGEKKLRPARVLELRPLVSERLDAKTRGVDDGFVLLRVDRANRVDDRAAGTDAFGGDAQKLELQLWERPCAPTEIGTAREHAEARAGRVDEHAVETG